MFNVNVTMTNYSELTEKGYTFEHNGNIVTLRDIYNKVILEIIYFEENHDLLINYLEINGFERTRYAKSIESIALGGKDTEVLIIFNDEHDSEKIMVVGAHDEESMMTELT